MWALSIAAADRCPGAPRDSNAHANADSRGVTNAESSASTVEDVADPAPDVAPGKPPHSAVGTEAAAGILRVRRETTDLQLSTAREN